MPPHTLEAPSLSTNRSLTLAEVEMLRAFNRRYVEQGWGARDYTRFVRFGAVRHLQAQPPTSDEPRLLTPQWAVDKAVEIDAEIVDSGPGHRCWHHGRSRPARRRVGRSQRRGEPGGRRRPARGGGAVCRGTCRWGRKGLVKPRLQTRKIGEIETAVRQEKQGRESVRHLARTEQRLAKRTAELDAFDDSGPTALGILRELAVRARRRLRRSGRAGPGGVAMKLLVLVTGVGRSGTSSMAGLLDQLGLYVPGPYLSANASNPKGFFESRWSVKFHNQIARALGSTSSTGVRRRSTGCRRR